MATQTEDPKLQRYRVDFGYGRYYFEPNDSGDWVKYEDAMAEILRLKEALLIVAQGTRCPELFPELSMDTHEWEIQAKTAEVSAIAALEHGHD